MISSKLENYLKQIGEIAGAPIRVEVVAPRGGAGGGNDPKRKLVWIVDDLNPQLRQEVIAHEATHVALYYEGWAFTRTPAAGPDARILEGIGALLTNAVQHPEIERRLATARIDARPGHRAKAARRIRGLAVFRRQTTHLEEVHEALFELDAQFLRDVDLLRRVEAEFSRALPTAVPIRDELRRILGTGPRSATESVELAQRLLGFLQLDGVSIATGRGERG